MVQVYLFHWHHQTNSSFSPRDRSGMVIPFGKSLTGLIIFLILAVKSVADEFPRCRVKDVRVAATIAGAGNPCVNSEKNDLKAVVADQSWAWTYFKKEESHDQ